MPEDMTTIIVLLILFVAMPAVVFHYITQWRKIGGLSAEDEHMIEDIWRASKKMERRIETLEAILDDEAPGWRKREDESRRSGRE
ncbi:MAG: envelope stress response membrane protein PspB [Maricaulaceae bacterium]|jgi:phage shock protein B